jgi:alcohol dehydrogenase class IV
MRRIARALQAPDAVSGMVSLAASLPIAQSLAALGMPASGLERAVELATRDAYANPRALEREAIATMLGNAFRGTSPAATTFSA